jgi:hypothetical protein
VRRWTRVAYSERCGQCGKQLNDGEPIIEITISGLRRRLVRGQCCAGDAPPDLPLDIVFFQKQEIESRMRALQPFKRLSEFSKDTLASREYMPYREPGDTE